MSHENEHTDKEREDSFALFAQAATLQSRGLSEVQAIARKEVGDREKQCAALEAKLATTIATTTDRLEKLEQELKSSIATVKTLEDRITHETTLRQAFEHKFENERQANQKIRLHVKEIEESMKPQFDALNEQIHKLENRITHQELQFTRKHLDDLDERITTESRRLDDADAETKMRLERVKTACDRLESAHDHNSYAAEQCAKRLDELDRAQQDLTKHVQDEMDTIIRTCEDLVGSENRMRERVHTKLVEELNRQSGKLDTTTAHTDQLLSKLERTDTSLVDCKKDVDRLNSLCNLQECAEQIALLRMETESKSNTLEQRLVATDTKITPVRATADQCASDLEKVVAGRELAEAKLAALDEAHKKLEAEFKKEHETRVRLGNQINNEVAARQLLENRVAAAVGDAQRASRLD